MVSLRLSVTAVAVVVLSGSAAAAPGARSQDPALCPRCTPPVFVINGRGWGHGVGLSQYGALGFARQGASFARILAHYYKGTELTQAPVKRIRVLLAVGAKTLAVGSAAPFRVRDARGELHELDAGTQRLGPGLRVREVGHIKPTQLQGPLVFLPGTEPLTLKGRAYHGELRVVVEKGRLRAINNLGLEAYLYGVVPSEMPHYWPPEALKAQAVAARSYALATRRSGDFDVYADVRSQVYRGIPEEEAPTNEAIDATAGLVVTYQGQVAHTYFFSTSGGRTATVTDVWPSSKPFPYLVSVPDPYDSLSPYHRWGPVVLAAAKARAQLKVPGPLRDLRATITGSGHVATLAAVGPAGETYLTGGDVRRLLGLRSTWFRVGALALSQPEAPVEPGHQLTLSGIARGLTGVTLEQRTAGSPWAPLAKLQPSAGGAFAVAVKPDITTQYRLAAGTARSAVIRVVVAHPPAKSTMLRP